MCVEGSILECQSEVSCLIADQRTRIIPQVIDGSLKLRNEICEEILQNPISKNVGRHIHNPQLECGKNVAVA